MTTFASVAATIGVIFVISISLLPWMTEDWPPAAAAVGLTAVYGSSIGLVGCLLAVIWGVR